jgi:hypothetical protein
LVSLGCRKDTLPRVYLFRLVYAIFLFGKVGAHKDISQEVFLFYFETFFIKYILVFILVRIGNSYRGHANGLEFQPYQLELGGLIPLVSTMCMLVR